MAVCQLEVPASFSSGPVAARAGADSEAAALKLKFKLRSLRLQWPPAPAGGTGSHCQWSPARHWHHKQRRPGHSSGRATRQPEGRDRPPRSHAICLSSTVLFQCQWRIITGIFLNDGTPRWLLRRVQYSTRTRVEHGKLAQHPPCQWQSLLLLGVSLVHSESAVCEGQVVPISDPDLDGTLQSCCMSVSSISHVEILDFASNEYLVAHVPCGCPDRGTASYITVRR